MVAPMDGKSYNGLSSLFHLFRFAVRAIVPAITIFPIN